LFLRGTLELGIDTGPFALLGLTSFLPGLTGIFVNTPLLGLLGFVFETTPLGPGLSIFGFFNATPFGPGLGDFDLFNTLLTLLG
jgi:hypothetical protein